jgi:hypothetical protein
LRPYKDQPLPTPEASTLTLQLITITNSSPDLSAVHLVLYQDESQIYSKLVERNDNGRGPSISSSSNSSSNSSNSGTFHLELPYGLELCGDIRFEGFEERKGEDAKWEARRGEELNKKKRLFRFWFNTYFVDAEEGGRRRLEARQSDIDIACRQVGTTTANLRQKKHYCVTPEPLLLRP